ncbi:MAG: hypothetical protein JOZ60_03635 [Verrucomicrobia bacterium]|nr:hypothetical protein [Verrucomicrobiota bacterium]
MLKFFKRASARISLVLLALGFSFLGILSFINREQGEPAISSALEHSCCFAGSAASLFAGAVFLVAACLHWRS